MVNESARSFGDMASNCRKKLTGDCACGSGGIRLVTAGVFLAKVGNGAFCAWAVTMAAMARKKTD